MERRQVSEEEENTQKGQFESGGVSQGRKEQYCLDPGYASSPTKPRERPAGC